MKLQRGEADNDVDSGPQGALDNYTALLHKINTDDNRSVASLRVSASNSRMRLHVRLILSWLGAKVCQLDSRLVYSTTLVTVRTSANQQLMFAGPLRSAAGNQRASFHPRVSTQAALN